MDREKSNRNKKNHLKSGGFFMPKQVYKMYSKSTCTTQFYASIMTVSYINEGVNA